MAATTASGAIAGFFFSYVIVAAAAAAMAGFDAPTVSFRDGFSHLFGNDNLICAADDRSVRLTLNRYSGN